MEASPEQIPIALFLSQEDTIVIMKLIEPNTTIHLGMKTALQMAKAILKIREIHFPEMPIPEAPPSDMPTFN